MQCEVTGSAICRVVRERPGPAIGTLENRALAQVPGVVTINLKSVVAGLAVAVLGSPAHRARVLLAAPDPSL